MEFCRLCMKEIKDETFETINEIHNDILDVLLLKLDLSEENGKVQTQVMCRSCAVKLQKCFQFKSTCLNTEDYLIPISDSASTKVDLRKVYLENNDERIPEDQNICRLCMKSKKIDNLTNVNQLDLGNILQKYFPEVNLESTIEPLFCEACVEAVRRNFHFVEMCLETENKIKQDRNLKITVSNKKKRKYPQESCQVDLEYSDEENYASSKESDKNEDSDSIRKTKRLSQIFTERKRATEGPTCRICKGVFKNKQILRNHQIVHKDPAQLTIYRCDLCPFQTKYKVSLKEHANVHKDRSELKKYKCDICPYEGIRKSALNKHLLTHCDPTEKKKFECSHCAYSTNNSSGFKAHKEIHDTSKLPLRKCPKCPYESRHKHLLRRHMIKHDSSDAKKYFCDLCSYSTIRKTSLIQHQLTHKDMLEVETFKCFHCSFETKRKNGLIIHMLTHTDPSKIVWYKCDKCPFQTKSKPYSLSHKLVHEDESKLTTYKCDLCDYTSKFKKNVQQHRRIHDDTRPHKCDICKFHAKTLSCLKRHMLTHAPRSKAAVYQCDICSYKAKRKDSLQAHVRTHEPSQMQVLYCEFCSFETRYKKSLKKHKASFHGPL